jgi:hypothetical protein
MEKFAEPLELTEAELMAVAGGEAGDLRTVSTSQTEASVEGVLKTITGQEAETSKLEALNGSAASLSQEV